MAITSNTLLQRFRRASSAAQHQTSLFDHIEQIPEDFLPITTQPKTRVPVIRADQEQYQLPTLTQQYPAHGIVTIG